MNAHLPGDPEVRNVRRGAGVLSYSDEGDPAAPALLAIHGLPGSGRDFRHLGPLLAPRLRFVRVELPGFGGSTWDDDALSFPGRARAVLDLADHLGLSRFAVLGHSMGGGTVLTLAAHHPARVTHLVLVSSVALRLHRGIGMPPAAFAVLSAAFRVPVLGDLLVPFARRGYQKRRFAGAEAMGRLEFARQLRAIAATDFALLRAAVRRPLPPTLVAFAEDDALVQTSVSEELAGALPSARVLRFTSGGHNLQKTEAPALAAAILDLMATA